MKQASLYFSNPNELAIFLLLEKIHHPQTDRDYQFLSAVLTDEQIQTAHLHYGATLID